ncbi:MAG: SET domain-containing protein-lysine N-methyltransferase [Saprospiraceae bacterium]
MDNVILSKDMNWELVEVFEKNFQLKKAINKNVHGLFANKNFKEGETIINFRTKNIVSKPTYLTVQLEDQKHFSLDPDFLQYMNHSCDPNIFMDTTELKLVTLRPISKDEELNFFYPSTEWEMEQAFICNCGSKECHTFISGAGALKLEVLNKYRLNEFIKRKLREAGKSI